MAEVELPKVFTAPTVDKVYGQGDQTRSFQYVTDLVSGLIKLMNSNYTLPINLGNPEEHTILEFAKLIKEQVGGSSPIIKKPAMQDDPSRRKPDITRARTYLNWEPKVQLLDGLQKTIDYFHNELSRSKHSERNFHPPGSL